jgi:S23 ribosomal protein.
MVLAEQVYRLTRNFPVDERFGLSSQLKRAAVCTRDYLRFLSMSMGSLAEIRTQLLLSIRLGLVDESTAKPALSRRHIVTKLLQALINSLQPKSDPIAAPDSSPFPVPRSRS